MENVIQQEPQSIIVPRATLNGLEEWMKHEYEHLGWMALANSRGENQKPIAYLQSLDRLLEQINYRKTITEKNEKHILEDLKVLENKVNLLKKFAKNLGITMETQQQGGKKKASKKVSKKTSKKSKKKASKK